MSMSFADYQAAKQRVKALDDEVKRAQSPRKTQQANRLASPTRGKPSVLISPGRMSSTSTISVEARDLNKDFEESTEQQQVHVPEVQDTRGLKRVVLNLFQRYGLKYTVEAELTAWLGDLDRAEAEKVRTFKQTIADLQSTVHTLQDTVQANMEGHDTEKKKLLSEHETRCKRLRILARKAEKKGEKNVRETLEAEYAEKNKRATRLEKYNDKKLKEVAQKTRAEYATKLAKQAEQLREEFAEERSALDGESTALKQIIEQLNEQCKRESEERRATYVQKEQYKARYHAASKEMAASKTQEKHLHTSTIELKKSFDVQQAALTAQLHAQMKEFAVLSATTQAAESQYQTELTELKGQLASQERNNNTVLASLNDRVKGLITKKDEQLEAYKHKYTQVKKAYNATLVELQTNKELLLQTKLELNMM